MEFILDTKDAWIASRSKGIGGSEVAAVLGLDPYRTPYSVWVEKTSGEARQIDNVYVRAGSKLEKIVVEYFAEETGFSIEVQDDNGFYQVTHPEYEYMRGSRDRVYIKPDGEKCILECKTTQSSIDKNDLPTTWFCQLQWYMGLYKVQNGAIAWLERGLRFEYVEIPFDKQFFAYLVEKVREFWEDYVIAKVEPPYLHVHDVESKYPLHTDGKVIEATQELYDVYNKLKELREKKKEIEKEEDDLIAQFKLAMKDSDRVMYHGNVLVTWRADKTKMVFDANAFQKENPSMTEKYMVEKIGVRRFVIK